MEVKERRKEEEGVAEGPVMMIDSIAGEGGRGC
jgi:hypothetical protein